MPRKGEGYATRYPLPREPYKARRLEHIRGETQWQLRDRESNRGRKKNPESWNKGRGWSLKEINERNRKTAFMQRIRLKAKIEKEIDEVAKQLQAVDKQLAERERIRDLANQAPTVKEMRGAVAALFKEEKLDPIKEMIAMVKRRGKGALPPHQRAMLLKELAQYQAPKPKSVDVQADMDMQVSVGLVDFRDTGQKVVQAAAAAKDEEYDEFEIPEDEVG